MRRRGGLDSVSAAVTDLTGAVRRTRLQRRELRLRLHHERGDVRTLDAAAVPGRLLIDAADALLAAAPPPRRREPDGD